MSAPIEMRQVVVGGVRSPVLQAGPPEATEAVVFVHGNPGPAEDWRDLADKAARLRLHRPGTTSAGRGA
jgi:pimeloyl-ACP methyl ester carboxylesterase